MSEAEKLCDRIAIIHRGKIHACDTLAGLRARTGQHYLEDIFVHVVRDSAAETAPLVSGATTP
jgi:ABC-type multidrug transport system ATPase subunit